MAATLEKIYREVAEIKLRLEGIERITEKEACDLLGITKSSIQVYVSNGTIPPSCYTVGIGGKRFYSKERLQNRKIN